MQPWSVSSVAARLASSSYLSEDAPVAVGSNALRLCAVWRPGSRPKVLEERPNAVKHGGRRPLHLVHEMEGLLSLRGDIVRCLQKQASNLHALVMSVSNTTWKIVVKQWIAIGVENTDEIGFIHFNLRVYTESTHLRDY